jgi:hypothetical protein
MRDVVEAIGLVLAIEAQISRAPRRASFAQGACAELD